MLGNNNTNAGNIGWITIGGAVQGPPGPAGPMGPQGPPGPPGGGTIVTNPATDALVVFASNATDPPAMKSADAPVTLGSTLTITAPTSSSSDVTALMVRANQSSASTRSVKLHVTNTASDSSSCGIALGKLGTTGWEMAVDPAHTNEDRVVLKRMGGNNALDISSSDMLVKATTGFSSTRYDIPGSSSSPGGSSTLWADSNGIVWYGSDRICSSVVAPTLHAIPAYGDTYGHLTTGTSITSATLSRPLTIQPPIATSGIMGLLIQSASTSGRIQIGLHNTSGTSVSGGITMGQPYVPGTSKTYSFNTDPSVNGGNDFELHKNSGPGNGRVIYIDNNGVITMKNGVISNRLTMTTTGSNPGNATTLWVDSADTTRPQYGSTALALQSDIKTDSSAVANNLVIYTDNLGNRSVATNPTQLVSTAGVIGASANVLYDPGHTTDPGSSYAGCIWMNTAADPNRPQFKSLGPMALLSDVGMASGSSLGVSMGTPSGFSVVGNTIDLYKVGSVVQVRGPNLIVTNTSGSAKKWATFAFTWPTGFAPSQASSCCIAASVDAGNNFVPLILMITSSGIDMHLPSGVTVDNGASIDTRTSTFFTYPV